MKPLQYLIAFVLAAVGCGCTEKKPDYDFSVVLKIVIHADGVIFVDGAATPPQGIPAKLISLKEKKGVVWFYRANPDGEPPPNAMDVLKMIIEASRPIQLFAKEDFSEFIDREGKPQKRK